MECPGPSGTGLGRQLLFNIFDQERKMAGSVDDSIAQMNQAAAQNAALMSASMAASTSIQGAASTAQTVNGANAAGAEVAKSTGNDMRQAAKAS